MKRRISVLLVFVMVFAVLTGCGSDSVADELEKFINTDMVGVNAKYDALKTEMGKWESLESDEALVSSLKDTIMPNIDESLNLLSKIELQTEEVKAIKEKYKKALDAYKEGFQGILSAVETDGDAEKEMAKLETALTLLDEYNKALEDLAKEKNMEVKY